VINRFSYHVTKYFSEYLPLHIGASDNTCKSYRDAFVQLLRFIKTAHRIKSDKIVLETITATIVEDFLRHLEETVGIGISTRNQRLAAIHSFFKYLQKKELACFGQCSDILAIPFKKKPQTPMPYMSIREVKILFSLPDTDKKSGLRDLAILAVLYETGARVQELIDLTAAHLNFASGSPYVELRGKGRKLRRIPIANEVADILDEYIKAYHGNSTQNVLFSNSQKKKLTRTGVQYIVSKYISLGKQQFPELFLQKITNHSFRHSKAMHLLEAGVNLIYIRDFLGHSSITTTEIYAKTNPDIKRKILIENSMLGELKEHYTPEQKDTLLDWLKNNL
jgi:site-specific recombinase XerD